VQVWSIECMKRLTTEEEAAINASKASSSSTSDSKSSDSSSSSSSSGGGNEKKKVKGALVLHPSTLRSVEEDDGKLYRMVSLCRLTTMSKPNGVQPLTLEGTKRILSQAALSASSIHATPRSKL
jgi:hypothetical protein